MCHYQYKFLSIKPCTCQIEENQQRKQVFIETENLLDYNNYKNLLKLNGDQFKYY